MVIYLSVFLFFVTHGIIKGQRDQEPFGYELDAINGACTPLQKECALDASQNPSRIGSKYSTCARDVFSFKLPMAKSNHYSTTEELQNISTKMETISQDEFKTEEIVKSLETCDWTSLYEIKDTVKAFNEFKTITLKCIETVRRKYYNHSRKVRQVTVLPREIIEDSLGNTIYLRDYYIKDFKYISPEALVEKNTRVEKKTVLQKWLLEVVNGLKQFFYEGSLHGVKYIFEPTFSLRERATWIILVVISISICAVNIIQLFRKWTSAPFVNVIDSMPTPIWAVPFPTVVLCPHLHVKLSYEKISELDDLEQFFASLVCPQMFNRKMTEQKLDMGQIHLLQDFVSKASPTCDDVIKTCNWPALHYAKWETKKCCELFQPIFTNYGLCFAFNSLPLNGMSNDTLPWYKSFNEKASPAELEWGLDSGYPKIFPLDPMMQPFRVKASGEANGLGLELYLNTSEHQFDCDGNSKGFTVLVSAPTDHVYTSTVLRLPMDRMTTVEVSPLTYKTDPSLRTLSPAQRQCYFQNERQLEYYQFYTDSNCKHDMLVNQAKETCDCVLFNWPRKHVREPICSTQKEYDCIELVRAKVEEQLIYAYFAESEEYTLKEESLSCHPSCNDVIYTSQVFYSDLAKDMASSHNWGRPASEEMTQVNIHFYDDIFLGQHRHAQYDHYYFAGAIGGLLSLFLGFSIISVAELVYFVILRPAYNVFRESYT